MKPRTHLLAAMMLAALSSIAHAAGPLTPPGAPGDGSNGGPSLTEINAAIATLQATANSLATAALNGRTAIPGTVGAPVAGPAFTISQPGSYLLTGNITVSTGNGINITADNVILDLNGFTIATTSVTAGDGQGVIVTSGPIKGVEIRNGCIRSGGYPTVGPSFVGAGFYSGIGASGLTTARDIHVSGCSIGISISALSFGNVYAEGTIDRCVAISCSSGMFASSVSNSRALSCIGTGISGSRITGCHGDARGTAISGGQGIYTGTYGNVSDSEAVGGGPGSRGIYSGHVHNSTGTSTGVASTGIECSTASFCAGASSDGVAITASVSASGCRTLGGSISSPSKHLGTP